MKNNDELARQIAQKVEQAFRDTPYPGDNNIGTGFDGEKIEEAIRGKHWKAIPIELIIRHSDILSFLADEAFRYYLPAFLLATLFHYNQVDIFPIGLINSLTPPDIIYRQHNTFQAFAEDAQIGFLKKVGLFNREERGAIKLFLDNYRELFSEEYTVGELKHLDDAIEFWHSFNEED